MNWCACEQGSPNPSDSAGIHHLGRDFWIPEQQNPAKRHPKTHSHHETPVQKQQQPSPPIKTALPLKNRRRQQKLSINYPQLSISIIYPRKKVSTPQQKITCNALGLDLDLRLEGPHRETKQLVRLMDRNPVIVDNKKTSIVTNDYHTNNRLIG